MPIQLANVTRTSEIEASSRPDQSDPIFELDTKLGTWERKFEPEQLHSREKLNTISTFKIISASSKGVRGISVSF